MHISHLTVVTIFKIVRFASSLTIQ